MYAAESSGPTSPLQRPASQVAPAPQGAPHAPQFAGSLDVSMQVPLQSLSLLSSHPHEPASHARPPGQALSHVPQWKLLVCESTQLCPQATSPSAHSSEQALSEQTSSAAQ